MKNKLFTGLMLAAAMLIAQPVFAFSRVGAAHARVRTVTRAHNVARVHTVSRGRAIAAVHGRGIRPEALATGRTFAAPVTHGYAATHTQSVNNNLARTNMTNRSSTSVAFGGSKGFNGRGTYAFASHAGWSHDQAYFWHGHHYHWYNNAWFIIDPYPVGYGYYGPNYGYGDGAPVSVEVQQALYNQGYYRGPVDGVVGPGTQAAIAAYQRDNGLRVTGTITNGLLSDLGIG